MESLDTAAGFMDDLLNFASDIGEEDDVDDDKPKAPSSPSSLLLNPNIRGPALFDTDDHSRLFPELAEEELEWISNKEAFPSVESFLLVDNPGNATKHQSPVSVLENSSSSSNSSTIMSCCGSLRVPVRARSKRHRKRRRGFPDVQGQQLWWLSQASNKNAKLESPTPTTTPSMGRKCQHCQAEKTPQWRAGPAGPKTLCNACGVRYKSGRLVPEYRPASSPTFSSNVHSNSHRKIVEMRRQKHRELG